MARYRNLDEQYWFLGSGLDTDECSAMGDEFIELMGPDNPDLQHVRWWEYWTVLRNLSLTKHDRVLDVGSWASYAPLLWLSRYAGTVTLNDAAQFTRGADTKEFKDWWTKLQPLGFGNFILLIRNIKNVALEADRFDVITTFSTLEHIDLSMDPDADTAASINMYRMLKPGGCMIGTIDFGIPEEGESLVRLYDQELFHTRIVEPAGWKYVDKPGPCRVESGVRSAMLYMLTK